MTFNPTLTLKDKALTKAFMARLNGEGKTYFTSDDFRRYRLDELMDDPAHDVGSYFAKLKFHGYAKRVGEEASEIGSNNRRRVDLWRWNYTVGAWLNMKPISAYCNLEE